MATRARNQILSPVGVCVLPRPLPNASRTAQYPDYIHEILAAAGLFYSEEELEDLPQRLPNLGVLVTVGDTEFSEGMAAALRAFVQSGGTWISIAGVCKQVDLLGVKPLAPAFTGFGGGVSNLGEGYLEPADAAHPALQHVEIPLHYYNGVPLETTGATVLATALDAHGRATQLPVLTENRVGDGYALCIAPDLTGAVVMIQQGRGGVTRDGIPAPDGTGPICDDVLKSGDGGALDWLLDRQPVPDVPGLQAFLQPVADQWRELLLRLIFLAGHRQKMPIPLLWLYPRNLPAIAHISLDTDQNDPDHAELLFTTLEEKSTKATWCTILPGLSRDFMEKIHAAGHELAMHYDAMTDGLSWGTSEFTAQWRYLVDLFGGRAPVTNKNHYLRWEGDTDIWDWCVAHQIQLDQSKGASKSGEAGFNFGTCRPYFPVTFGGRKIDVLELPTFTQDLEVFVPWAFYHPLQKAVIQNHGILHLLFHPAHTHKPATNKALRDAIDEGRKAGLEWWTATQINTWERARRTVTWTRFRMDDTGASAAISTGADLPDATILWVTAPATGDKQARWGFTTTAQQLTLKRDEPQEVQFSAGTQTPVS